MRMSIIIKIIFLLGVFVGIPRKQMEP